MPDHLFLALIVLLVAVWNASVGPSGAVTFAAMATVLPPLAVVPIHAAVEAVSAVVRSVLLREYVDWLFALFFLSGALVGFLLSAPVLYSLPITDDALRIALGCTILIVTWARLPGVSERLWKFASVIGGLTTSFATVFVGATSPLVTALVQQRLPDHRETLGTSSVCMALQHGGKILIFGLIGFSFAQYAELIAILIGASIGGNWLGRYVLIRAPQALTKTLFKTIVTALALHLIWKGMSQA